MSQQLTLELSDEAYADLQQKASSLGLSISEWIIAVISHQSASNVLPSLAQQEEARQRFRSHAGAVGLGYVTGLDNEGMMLTWQKPMRASTRSKVILCF